MTNLDTALGGHAVEEQQPTFALDIGTRSVIGVVGRQEGGLFHVLDIETKEHTKRAMFDGQIEDIGQVAEVARAVKNELERRQGLTLQRVCVAAAGRALRTVRAFYEMELSSAEPVSPRAAYEMEMAAVANARAQLEETEEGRELTCVGHAVVRFYLDDYPFLTIVSHKGSRARVEIIATFLPNGVVESLYSAMAMIGLEVDQLTLEPIAAMNAVIPAELRLLNLALVDIGAGTSDIAISESGSVCAYTMATVAGDEITESLIHRFLVDFRTAEDMKHTASEGTSDIVYHDILGFEYTVPLEDVLSAVRPAVEELGGVVCEKILEANSGKAPAAVFLVGGGSQVPLLNGIIADRLGLDPKKVAVGGNNFIKRVVTADFNLDGPELATPLGIALTAVNSGAHEGFYVTINGKRMRVFRGGPMSAMDVLLLCGFQYADLMGKSGKSLTYELNGQRRFLRGGYLVPAQISIGGVAASISTLVSNGDEVHVDSAASGTDALLRVRDLEANPAELTVMFNGTPIVAGRRILVNGSPAQPDDEIHDLDKVEHYDISTLCALCAQMGMATEGRLIVVNGKEEGPEYLLKAGDQVMCVGGISTSGGAMPASVRQVEPKPEAPTQQEQPAFVPTLLREALPEPIEQEFPDDEDEDWEEEEEDAQVMAAADVAQEPLVWTPPVSQPALAVQAATDGASVGLVHVIVNDVPHVLPKKDMPYQFLDMLNLVDIDPSKPQGNIILQLNGREASYLEVVSDNDQIEIYWDKQ